MANAKRCFKCDCVKPLSDFYSHPQMRDEHLGKCKECAKNDVTLNRLKNVGKIRGYDRNRYEGERKTIQDERSRQWRIDNPYGYKAQMMVSNAIRDGRLEKPSSCSRCHAEDRVIHGHHRDYDKPLEVEWLCPVCHALEKKANA